MKLFPPLKEISITEIEGLRIGNAQDLDAMTGVTVLRFDEGAKAGCDISGGGPASRETPLTSPVTADNPINAIVFSGGSAFGLAASDGVMRYLEEHGIGYDTGFAKVPLVCQSCIYDLSYGDPKIRPTAKMGEEACRQAFAGTDTRTGKTAVKKKNSRSKRRKSSRVRQRNQRILMSLMLLVIIVLIGWIIINRASENGWSIGDFLHNSDTMISDAEQSGTDNADSSGGPEQWQKEGAPYIDVELLTPNEYSRPQIPIESVQYIAIHYTANPGATAIANRNYFENLATTHDTKVSSHFVVGLDGEVVQCIPTSEMSYATNSRNVDTLSIECCHPDETGKFNEATYDSAVKLSAWLCVRFGLTSENVIRHYDVTGKNCPKYYVENPDAWIQMKSDIAAQIDVDYGLQDVQ